MGEELIRVVMTGIRIFFVTIPAVFMTIYFADAFLVRKRNIKYLIWYFIFKTMLVNVIMSTVLRTWYEDKIWWQFTYLFLVLTISFVNFGMFYFVFPDDFLKTSIIGIMSEVMASGIMIPSIMIVNRIQKREHIYSFNAEFVWGDFLFLILGTGLFIIIYHFIAPYLNKFRSYRLRHRKLLWMILILYMTAAMHSMIVDSQTEFNVHYIYSIPMLLYVLSVVCIAGWSIRIYQHQQEMEYEYLLLQQRLFQTHYETVQRQIVQMEAWRSIMEEQMEKIADTQSEVPGNQITEYLDTLRQAYTQICAGIYCNDWMIDAVLFTMADWLDKNKIEFNCSMQGYERGTIRENDMMQLLVSLLKFGYEENVKLYEMGEKNCTVSLWMTTVKNQMIIEYRTTCSKTSCFAGYLCNTILKKYNGNIHKKIIKHDHSVSKDKKQYEMQIAMNLCNR